MHEVLKIKPRLYQEKILSTAVKGNTLVVLPTGLGKTLIAIMLGLIRQKYGKVVFLAPTKPLVEQHAKTIEEVTGIKPAVLHGGISFEKRKEKWENASWVVETPQTLQNDLLRGISIKDVALIVFDEAHRAVGNYAYVYIARRYMEEAKNPHIIALTASPGSEEEKIREILDNLSIEYIEVRTEWDEDVRPYIKEKAIQWVSLELPPAYKEAVKKVKKVLSHYLRLLKSMGIIESADVNAIRRKELIDLQAKVAGDPDALSAVAAAIKASHALELIETQSMYAYSKFLERLKEDRSRAARELLQLLPEPLPAEHPKMKKLVEILSTREQAIVFANYADQVDYIIKKLEKHGISCRKFVGQRQGMSQKEQKEIIEAFKRGEFQVLVTTSVGEEGIDLPSVSLVVFYEPVPSAIRNVQRRGRLRKGGKVYILVTKGTREQGYLYAARARERRMVKLLKSLRPQLKAQMTLDSFEKTDKPHIIVDDRETAIAKLLGARIKRVEVGDFIISDRIAVERKTAKDFVDSIIDGRLFEQISNLKKAYEKPILIIEGFDLYSHRAVHPNAIRGALASLIVDWNVPVIFTRNREETAEFLRILAKREHEAGRAPTIKVPKGETLKEKQEFLVSALPGINLTLARRLLKKFKSPLRVFTASLTQLTDVEGIGEKKAREIKRVLEEEYDDS